jgi:hypothetical protein
MHGQPAGGDAEADQLAASYRGQPRLVVGSQDGTGLPLHSEPIPQRHHPGHADADQDAENRETERKLGECDATHGRKM